ncbi:hypothetical protein HKCCE4037_13580 [Rhodobacterales bacterium HKCCE4037]|nr:hypothetical protein [Rhodobacterales bacterium HKCCE4037]
MRDLLRILAPLLFWLAAFSAIYGLHGLACSRQSDVLGGFGLSAAAAPLAAWGMAIAIQSAILVMLHLRPAASAFVQRVSLVAGWTALGAMLWSLFPLLLNSGCA